ncbi:hypothetical protein BC833DRAFT_608102 [Globomyces pollinis-pini]|nr:hypothetical protein BC833DRAFT_608102 [Globomyces pollinis-pini]
MKETQTASETLCVVCELQESKYKCPKCLAKYCSVICYRIHKQSPCSLPKEKEQLSPSDDLPEKKELDIPEYYQLNEKHYDALKANPGLKELLKNPNLQELVRKVDHSHTPELELDNFQHNPQFLEFTNLILDIIEQQNKSI